MKSLLILLIICTFIACDVNEGNKEYYKDYIEVLTINGDTARIYHTSKNMSNIIIPSKTK